MSEEYKAPYEDEMNERNAEISEDIRETARDVEAWANREQQVKGTHIYEIVLATCQEFNSYCMDDENDRNRLAFIIADRLVAKHV